MSDTPRLKRRTALRTIGLGATAQLGFGLVAGDTAEGEQRLEIDDINEEVQKAWQSTVRRHGEVVDTEYAAIGPTNVAHSSKRLASVAKANRDDGRSMMIQRLEFEDGYTAEVTTAMDRDGSTFLKKINDQRFKTILSSDDVGSLKQNQREKVVAHSERDADFAASANPSKNQVADLSKKSTLSATSSHYDYSATEADDGDSDRNCPGPCWVQGINWATDVDEDDNRCGVTVTDAAVSIEADAYAEVYTLVDNDMKTGDFDITFDGYTAGTVSSLGMAAGTDFLGFVRNVDKDTQDSIHLGTLSSDWYDAVDIIDEQWGPGDGAGPGDDAPYTDYEFTTELIEGDTYAFGIRMAVDLANLSLPGAITINFTDTSNPLDKGFGMSYNVIGADYSSN